MFRLPKLTLWSLIGATVELQWSYILAKQAKLCEI
jgi:hypothetical protein